MVISSLENNKVKDLVKLQQKKYRDLTNTYLVEGEHLVEEVLKEDIVIELIVLEGEEYSYSCETSYVSYDVMKKISTLDTPPKIMALCKKKENLEILGNRILLLDEVQDPGNLGTIIRSSLAFSIDTIILSNNCCDLYNPKVLRSTQGIFCHINILTMDTYDAIKWMGDHSIPLYGTSVVGGVEASSLTNEEKEAFCLIMGNEGKGLSNDILSLCDKKLYIPMNSKVESLNVGVACSILLYELGRYHG